MAERTAGQEERTVKRRGLIAGAAALAAGVIARRAMEPQDVAAANGSSLHLGEQFNANNTCTLETGIFYNSVAAPADGAILLVSDSASPTIGFPAVIGGHAVNGSVPNGVTGRTYRLGGKGVVGEADGGAGANASGVYGFSDAGTGVYGDSQGLFGVYGTTTKVGGVGVYGHCGGGYGVYGDVSDGEAVFGQAVTGHGVRGYSQMNHAIVGQTGRTYFGGVYGVATLTNTVGIYGSTFNGATYNMNAFAGYMDGNFVVANGFKSAGVPHKDGTHRLVYCMESPENWFEDFGEAKLVGGKAEVTIDPDFAAIVLTDAYHVFLTPMGDSKGLYVTGKSATGFSVREQQGGTSNLGFSYRIVAKRKDIKAERLAKFDLPLHRQAAPPMPQAPKSPVSRP